MKIFKEIIKKNTKLYNLITNMYIFMYESVRSQKKLYISILRLKALLNKEIALNKFEFISYKDFCTKNNYKYSVLEKKKIRRICKPNYYGRCNGEQTKEYLSPEIYLAEMDNVKIIGGNGFVLGDNYCLFDMAVANDADRYDLRFESLKMIERKHAIIEYKTNNKFIEEAVFLLGFASFNYYHITVEIMSRLQYIDQFEEYRGFPLLIDKIVLEVPQYKDFLKYINIYKHPIIPIETGNMHVVKRLIYPSYNTWMPINVKKRGRLIGEDFLIANSGIEHIGNTVLTGRKIENNRKIFISRKKVNNQRLINEIEIMRIFKKYGFEIIYPEELSFDKQVKVFSEAKYVAGSTGAAFTNILYCQKNATIICLLPMEHKFYMWSTIAKILNLNSVYLDAKIIKKGKNISRDNFEVDLEYCEEFLKSI